jgi:hypothetical protein
VRQAQIEQTPHRFRFSRDAMLKAKFLDPLPLLSGEAQSLADGVRSVGIHVSDITNIPDIIKLDWL